MVLKGSSKDRGRKQADLKCMTHCRMRSGRSLDTG